MSASAHCARVLVAQFVAQGVGELVLCPGSRSAPLALAAWEADAAGLLRLHVRTDERSAGFLALGLAKASGVPTVVVTTSGTAVGNLLPAVMEASHAGVALIVVTADRPAAMVGFGANQTSDQVGIFGGFVHFAARITSAASPQVWAAQAAKAWVMAASGPVHCNVELEVPLVTMPDELPTSIADLVADAQPLVKRADASAEPVELPVGPRTVIVAGDADPTTGRQATELAVAAALPLIAEPSSNARLGAHLPCGRLVLGTDLAAEVERVIVFGHPTLSRPVLALLGRADVEVIVIATGDWADPGLRARLVVPAVSLPAREDGWLQRWRAADAAACERVRGVVGAAGLSGWSLASAVWAAAADQPLVLGASQLIRDADLVSTDRVAPLVYANRGLAGIDGTVSTAVGVALALGRPTTLLCGDLTFLHDANGLALGAQEARPDLRIVVADDAGGAIFATLEYGAEPFAASFERVFGTDPGVDVAALAASLGVPTVRVSTAAELDQALARPISGIDVVVVGLDRSRRRSLNQAING